VIYALVGALAMFSVLVGIGINQPRETSTPLWCFFYLVISVVFDGLVVAALLFQNTVLVELLLGLSAGAATGLGIHVMHHVLEERKGTKSQGLNH
jgi:predicted RND superfamily exporter protein